MQFKHPCLTAQPRLSSCCSSSLTTSRRALPLLRWRHGHDSHCAARRVHASSCACSSLHSPATQRIPLLLAQSSLIAPVCFQACRGSVCMRAQHASLFFASRFCDPALVIMTASQEKNTADGGSCMQRPWQRGRAPVVRHAALDTMLLCTNQHLAPSLLLLALFPAPPRPPAAGSAAWCTGQRLTCSSCLFFLHEPGDKLLLYYSFDQDLARGPPHPPSTV